MKTKAVILCGGQGTRIRDVSDLIPKPMLPIGGKPILWHIMKRYAFHGVTDFVLCLGYKGWMIKDFFIQYHAMTSDVTIELGYEGQIHYHGPNEESGWRVTLADTGENTQTGGRLWSVRQYLEDCDVFHLTYGDGVADVDLTALSTFHTEMEATASLTAVRPAGRFGELDFENGLATSFQEKPNVTGGHINGGFMVFHAKKIWDYLRPGADLNLETDVLPNVAKDRQLSVFEHDGFWQCMDTMREYKLLNDLWDRGEAPWLPEVR